MMIPKTALLPYPLILLHIMSGCENQIQKVFTSAPGKTTDSTETDLPADDTVNAEPDTDSDSESGDGKTKSDTGIDTIRTDTADTQDTGGDTDTDGNTDTDTDVGADGDGDTDTETEDSTIPTTCDAALKRFTSVGCEFYTVDLDQYDDIDPLTYAVVVSNPQSATPANIRIQDMRGPGGTLRTLPGTEMVLVEGALYVYELTCADGCPETTAHIDGTGLLRKSAFKVVSDIPILSYQWNTYGTGLMSTDASLLLPTAVLDKFYIGTTWQYGNGAYRSELTVVATEDNTTVTFTPTTAVEAGGSVPTLQPDVESVPIVLNAFDVVQIQSTDEVSDLSGTLINASAPISVFGGHSVAFVPYMVPSGDHVEEQLLPLSAWGKDAVLARYPPRPDQDNVSDPAVWRVVSGAADMTVYFDPPVNIQGNAPGDAYHFIEAGEVLEFNSPTDHYIRGELDTPTPEGEIDAPFSAYQLMTGQCYPKPACSNQWGDPMMLLSAPAGQYLDRYVFNTDAEYDFAFDYVIVIKPKDAKVEIDCLGILDDGNFSSVGNSQYEVGRFALDYDGIDTAGCIDGPHRLVADTPVGLSVVGFDVANSYGYLGGIGVWAINPIIPVV